MSPFTICFVYIGIYQLTDFFSQSTDVLKKSTKNRSFEEFFFLKTVMYD